jgi:hypothetical protein
MANNSEPRGFIPSLVIKSLLSAISKDFSTSSFYRDFNSLIWKRVFKARMLRLLGTVCGISQHREYGRIDLFPPFT